MYCDNKVSSIRRSCARASLDFFARAPAARAAKAVVRHRHRGVGKEFGWAEDHAHATGHLNLRRAVVGYALPWAEHDELRTRCEATFDLLEATGTRLLRVRPQDRAIRTK